MRKFLLTAVAFLAAAAFCHSQTIYNIDTRVYIVKNGNAVIEQTWDLDVESGTEYYIPIDNPGNSYIRDLSVYENDVEFENDGRRWDSSRSREEKTGRCGIVEKGGGDVELCWGQGEYGHHVWEVCYIIEDLVQDYGEDGDGFHWHFLNDEWSAKPQHARIRIYNETEGEPWFFESQDSCNVQFWGFGMVGESSLEDGVIVFESTEPFQYKSFFSALCLFKKGQFVNLVKGRESFEELREAAMKGSDYGKDDGDDVIDKIVLWILGIIFLGIPILIILYLIFLLLQWIYRKITGRRYNKKIFGVDKIEGWSRDVPLDGDVKAVFSLIQSGDYLARSSTKVFPDLVSAYFLKWVLDGLIKVEPDPKKEGRMNLRFVSGGPSADEAIKDVFERDIFLSARVAAGDDLLEALEFKKWSYQNDVKVAGWPNEAVSSGRPIWNRYTPEQRVRAIEFKRFLEDFTLVDEREAPEIGLWKQYMTFAALFGIADKVAKNFEKLFPAKMEEYARQTNMMNTMTTYYILNSITSSSSAMMSSAIRHQEQRAAAKAAAERRSSGGGGHISFGGGGGGYGGGHGGGSR